MRQILFTAIVLLSALGASASAQTTQPAGGSLEQKPLTPTTQLSFAPPRHMGGGSSDLLSFSQLASALFIVLTLIFAAKWVVPKVWPAVVAQRNNAVRVIGRTPISPKNQIVLVQVGSRILVLGENAGQLSTLSTVEDSNEVALLVGKTSARTEPSANPETTFDAALAHSNRAYEQPVSSETSEDVPAEAATSGELSDLIGKVRSLARHLGRQ